jgi:hypothetical protein
VRIIELDSNIGHVAANNLGLSMVQGDFAGILDADDFALRSDALRRQLEIFDTHPDVGLVYTAHAIVDGDGQEISRSVPWPQDYVRAGLDEFEQLMWSNYIPHSGTLLRRSVLDALGAYKPDLPYSGDWERWLRVAAAGQGVGYVAQPMYAYRVHSRNMHHRGVSPRQAADELVRTLENAYAELPASGADVIRARRASVMRHAVLQTAWVDHFHRRSVRTAAGVAYALARRPGVVLTREFWGLCARLAGRLCGAPFRLAASRSRSVNRPA